MTKIVKADDGWKEPFLEELRENYGNVSMTLRKHNADVAKGKCKRVFPKFKQAVHRHAKNDKKFKDAIEEIRDNSEPDKIEFVEGALWMGIARGDKTLIIFALKNLLPEKYKDRSQIGLDINPQEFVNSTLDNIRNEIKKDREQK